MKNTNGVRTTADTGDDRNGQLALGLEDLRAGLTADHFVKVAHHGRIRVGAEHAPKEVMRAADISYPVAHGFVDRVFQGAGAGVHAADFGAQQAHAEDVQFLTAHVLGAHVNDALEAEQRAHRGGGDAVLAGPGLGDDAALAHALGEQRLSQAVVDLVGAGVKKIFALQINSCAAELLSEMAGEEQGRRTSGVGAQEFVEPAPEAAIASSFLVFALQFLERRHQRLGNVAATIDAEAAGGFLCHSAPCHAERSEGSAFFSLGFDFCNCHAQRFFSAIRTAATKSYSLSGSFWHSPSSMLDATSTRHGLRIIIAALTFVELIATASTTFT